MRDRVVAGIPGGWRLFVSESVTNVSRQDHDYALLERLSVLVTVASGGVRLLAECDPLVPEAAVPAIGRGSLRWPDSMIVAQK